MRKREVSRWQELEGRRALVYVGGSIAAIKAGDVIPCCAAEAPTPGWP